PGADLRPHLPDAGVRDALRQLLRRRRPQLEPHRPGDDTLGAARAAAGGPLPRHLRARLILCQGGSPPPPAPGPEHSAPAGVPRGRGGGRVCGGQALRCGTEIQVTALEMVRRLLRLMGSALEPDVRGEATNEIKHQYLSAEKARRMLDWSPHYGLDEALAET